MPMTTTIITMLLSLVLGLEAQIALIETAEATTTPVVLIEPPTVEDKIRAYDWDDDIAIAVAKAESSLNPKAYNPEWHRNYLTGKNICQGSFGVFQTACIHHIENPNALYDEDFNIKKAYEIYSKEGWRPWSAYNNGNYLKYLP